MPKKSTSSLPTSASTAATPTIKVVQIDRAALKKVVLPIYASSMFFNPHDEELDLVVDVIAKKLDEKIPGLINAKMLEGVHREYRKAKKEAAMPAGDGTPGGSEG